MNSTQPGENPEVLADRYWRSVCALASCHLLGTTWPPPGVPQRGRLVGHWGCNPGIGWITAHLASHWSSEQPLLMVVGTGHASSFVFAHNALQTRADPAAITAAAARYGQPHGDPAELVGQPNVPYLGGELGPALAVSQGLAAAGRHHWWPASSATQNAKHQQPWQRSRTPTCCWNVELFRGCR